MEQVQRLKTLTTDQLHAEVDALDDERLEAVDAALRAVLDEGVASEPETPEGYANRGAELVRLLKVAFAVKSQRHLRLLLAEVERRHQEIVTSLDARAKQLSEALADRSTTNAAALGDARTQAARLQEELAAARQELQRVRAAASEAAAATSAAAAAAPASSEELARLTEDNERLRRELAAFRSSIQRAGKLDDADLARVQQELAELFARRRVPAAEASGGLVSSLMPGFLRSAGT
jgi:DNA repair exonuclease SbcCD ATPase subunit